ncbi:MAG TPA: GntR family transcriptional regulator [Phycisphaerales bacterium]|nr:GntR family transcriptional regulator [Phycisphaerales bacterium]HBR20330.1 GntR family transcriptional regulator [Phycisphaerales bacterium]
MVRYNSKALKQKGVFTIYIRIEPSSSVPIYRQIIDQIKYQVATGSLREGDKVPSVRELASNLAVNQNTILKVYNELCRENVLKIERGDGTYVSSNKQNIPSAERKKIVANVLREAVIQAIQLDVSLEQASELLKEEYEAIKSERNK